MDNAIAQADRDRIVSVYRELISVNATADKVGLSYQTVRRILLDAGEELTPRTTKIRQMIDDGVDPNTIATELGIKPKTVRSYAKYTRGSYKIGEKSIQALRNAACRERKRAKKPT